MEMLWYVLGLVAMFYFGYLVAAIMCAGSRMDDAEIDEIRAVAGSDEPCPVHGDEPCIRWFLHKACGHCTADDMRRYIAEGRAEMIQGAERWQQRQAP